MRVVSNQSEADIRRHETRAALTQPLRELTANLLRVARGAGKPWLVAQQLSNCLVALRAYVDAHDALPSDQEIHAILDCETAWNEYRPWIKERQDQLAADDEWRDPGLLDHELGARLIRNGVLQEVASMLLNQIPQRGNAEQEIREGIRRLEEASAKRRAHRAAHPLSVGKAVAKLNELGSPGGKRPRHRKRSSPRPRPD